MTLLRRAPREVYRVYAEDEFFDGPGLEKCFEASRSRTDGRLRRFAGVTMLLAAAGTVGGMVANTSMSSTGNGRRAGAGLLAGASLLGAARVAQARVWQQPAGGPGSLRPGGARRRTTLARAPRRAGIPPRAAAFRGSRSAALHRSVAGEVASRVGSVAVAVSSPPSSRSVAATMPNPGASPGVPGPRPSEFGFERGGAQ